MSKLDTEELNRQFYQDLFNWFEWAQTEAKFPEDKNKQENVIRLITRILFIWFIKEKGLVSDELFNEHEISKLLKNYDRKNGDSYYRAVLQNLFFASLNTEVENRGFKKQGNKDKKDEKFSRYLYKNQISDTKGLISLFSRTPFINGGLFDCLDSEKSVHNGGYQIDCFSDNESLYRKLSLPNRLFFDEESGLFPLLNRYKFTVEENTPIEQEVALDPELLGKVFENLLAAYNPETHETARKKTGSYYTPRTIVNYMVDEVLVGALLHRCCSEDSNAKSKSWWQDRLRYLLDYADEFNDAKELFEEGEVQSVVVAISEISILDPAVGSGAFLMGVLHKLTLALRRIDPNNKHWGKLQKEYAQERLEAVFDNESKKQRREKLSEINETFECYSDSDLGRKLHLIQNNIFGVDIQSIACQIAKLRFFISLAIEQQPNSDSKKNFGIRALPNLKTRFIVADTLKNLNVSGYQYNLFRQGIELLGVEDRLDENRRRHFLATTISQKNACKVENEQLRYKLREQLNSAGLAEDYTNKIAQWNPYDQNAKADWFDPEYMFGKLDGFDVVIGNPPYIESRNSLLSNELKDSYGGQVFADWKETLPRGSDLLIYFYARSAKFLKDSGYGCFITQNAWLSTDYGKKFQEFSLGKFSFRKIIDTSARFFSDTRSQNINAVITVFTKKLHPNIEYGIADSEMMIAPQKIIKAKQKMKWEHVFSMPEFFTNVLCKMYESSDLGNAITFGQGINLPTKALNMPEARLPIIVKDSKFIATSADGRVSHNQVSSSRRNKIPGLIMPRGIGNRHYCIFNACKAFSYSHVELYLPNDLWESDLHYCLWAYLNSSLVWLFREITGRKNLGGGLLKAEATDMKALPVGFNFDFANEAKKVLESVRSREPLPVSEEICTHAHLLIDEMISDYFGFINMHDIRKALIEKINFRLSRANS